MIEILIDDKNKLKWKQEILFQNVVEVALSIIKAAAHEKNLGIVSNDKLIYTLISDPS